MQQRRPKTPQGTKPEVPEQTAPAGMEQGAPCFSASVVQRVLMEQGGFVEEESCVRPSSFARDACTARCSLPQNGDTHDIKKDYGLNIFVKNNQFLSNASRDHARNKRLSPWECDSEELGSGTTRHLQKSPLSHEHRPKRQTSLMTLFSPLHFADCKLNEQSHKPDVDTAELQGQVDQFQSSEIDCPPIPSRKECHFLNAQQCHSETDIKYYHPHNHHCNDSTSEGDAQRINLEYRVYTSADRAPSQPESRASDVIATNTFKTPQPMSVSMLNEFRSIQTPTIASPLLVFQPFPESGENHQMPLNDNGFPHLAHHCDFELRKQVGMEPCSSAEEESKGGGGSGQSC